MRDTIEVEVGTRVPNVESTNPNHEYHISKLKSGFSLAKRTAALPFVRRKGRYKITKFRVQLLAFDRSTQSDMGWHAVL